MMVAARGLDKFNNWRSDKDFAVDFAEWLKTAGGAGFGFQTVRSGIWGSLVASLKMVRCDR